jgi:predicted TPR repeat methyltransferase
MKEGPVMTWRGILFLLGLIGAMLVIEKKMFPVFCFLRSRAPLDLVVAADVLVYFGDLAPFLAACRDAVKIGGLITFTTETLISEGGGNEAGVDDVDVGVGVGGDSWQLTVSGRYAHSPTYVIGAGMEAGGLSLIKEEAITPRCPNPKL